MDEAARQRIKAIVEQGDVWPIEKAVTRTLFVRLTLMVIVVDVAVELLSHYLIH